MKLIQQFAGLIQHQAGNLLKFVNQFARVVDDFLRENLRIKMLVRVKSILSRNQINKSFHGSIEKQNFADFSYRMGIRFRHAPMLRPVALIVALWPVACPAQQLPTLSYETKVFNAVTAAGISPVPNTGAPPTPPCTVANTMCPIENRGQGQHLVTYCIVGGTVSAIKIWIEGSNDSTIVGGVLQPTNWLQISPEGDVPIGTNGCGTLQATGYFSYLRIDMNTLTGVAPVITAWYSGFGTVVPGLGVLISNTGSQPVTLNPSTGTTQSAKSTPVALGTLTTLQVYGLSASNPNTAASFVSLTCGSPAVTTLEWEIPANDTRELPVGTAGYTCGGPSAVACSTSATSAVDPTNSCLINVIYKPFTSVRTQVTFGGVILGAAFQTPN